ncbi:Transcriptional regulator, partial [Dysosmobacter welbionis]
APLCLHPGEHRQGDEGGPGGARRQHLGRKRQDPAIRGDAGIPQHPGDQGGQWAAGHGRGGRVRSKA